MSVKDTQYGFFWGQVEVSRLASDDKGWKALAIRTPRKSQELQIYITKTGKVRIWKNHKELTK